MGLAHSNSEPILHKANKELNFLVEVLEDSGQVLETLIECLNKKELQFGITVQALKLSDAFRMGFGALVLRGPRR